MRKTYQLGAVRRAFNAAISPAIRLGLAPPSSYLLTTTGRKTGIKRTTPVSVVTRNGLRYLVAPYGAVGWVHNVRASGRVTLSRRGRSEELGATEVEAAEAASVFREYLRKFRVVAPFFDAEPKSPIEEFVAEAPQHPVFRLDG